MKRWRVWDTFLRIAPPATTDTAPVLDDEWLQARGVYPGAPLVLRRYRDDVLPLIRRLERSNQLAWYFFLIHDLDSGVPTTTDDKSPYVHLRLVFKKAINDPVLPSQWRMTKSLPSGDGVDGPDERLIGYQSEFVLRLIESLSRNTDEARVVKQIKQYLHYFSNMLQMRIL